MKLKCSSLISLVIASGFAALVLLPAPAARAGCIITIAPDNTDTNGVPELAGGPEELFGCSQTRYFRSTRRESHRSQKIRTGHVSAATFRSHTPAPYSQRARDITRAFGFRYPGFKRVYSNSRYTTAVRIYRGNTFTGSTNAYSGPRYSNTTPTLRPRHTGFSKTFSGRRYTGFTNTYNGPRYPGSFNTTRRTRW